MDVTLSLRELNRTTLRRQLLLERGAMSPHGAVEQLVALQAQLARPPYVGLWTRLATFAHADLATQIESRQIVKATFLRGTLHLLTARDYLRFRASLQPVLTSALQDVLKQRAADVDVDRMVAAAREFIEREPRSFAEITTLLTGLEPTGDPGGMRYAVRTHLPMVQVPVSKTWSFPGNPRFTLADAWLASPLPDGEHLPELVKRYLAAFGPATVNDMQTWSYLHNLQPVFEALGDELVSYRDEHGRRLFDLPESAIESADVSAPPRFLPEFDNLLLAHRDRTRVVADAYRSRVYLPGLRVAATVLLDGFVAGTWTTERSKKAATLRIRLFETPARADRARLTDEGERLLRFAEPDALAFDVQLTD